MKVYKQSEVARMVESISLAKNLWAERSAVVFKEKGDVGSCIIGDGIEILVLPPKCRKPKAHMIIWAREISSCQGSCHYEATQEGIIDFLKGEDIEARYNYGRMD